MSWPEKADAEASAKGRARLDKGTWKRIEVEYRAGVPATVSAKRYDIPPSTIYNRAARKGWKKAEGGALIAATQAQALLQADLEGEVATLVQDTLTVVHRHRSDIRELGTLGMTMLNELRALTLQRDELQALFKQATQTLGGDGMTPEDAKAALAAFRDLAALPKRIAALAQVTGTMEKLQAMEREAYGLKAAEKPIDPEGEDDTIKGLVVAFVDAPFRELE